MLEIFPERMLDSSLHTAILVGIVTLWLFTETFGWVFAGFIVPGYLASMAIVAPVSLFCIIIEAILTYGFTYILGTSAAQLGLWHSVFGRNRFLLFILVSIPIRILVEGELALPMETMLSIISDNPSIQSGRFFGIGMVLVPLLANAWWKTGMAKGVLQMSIVSGLCYVIIQYGFSAYTNFHFGGFELTFENIAMDFLSVPKPYIILVMTAIMSAHNNIRYGWNFGGILLPSLLAVVALSPLKFAATLFEIVVLTLLYRGLIRLPMVRNLNLSGPRQIVSMYALAFCLKWLIAQFAESSAIQFYISDFYGFGYLLTSLVAIRCLKESIPRTMLPLLYTTGQGLGLGLGLSLWLGYLMPNPNGINLDNQSQLQMVSMADSVLESTANIRTQFPEEGLSDNLYSKYLEAIQLLVQVQSADGLSKAAEDLKDPSLTLEWAIRSDNHRCLAVKANRQSTNFGAAQPNFWWCGGQGPGLVAVHPKTDPDSLWLTAWIAQNSKPSFVLISSIDLSTKLIEEQGTEAGQVKRRFKQLRNAFGDRSVLLTSSGTTTYLDPISDQTGQHIGNRLGPLSNLPIRFTSFHGSYQMWWDNLQDKDGIIQINPESMFDSHSEDQPLDYESTTLSNWLDEMHLKTVRKIAGTEDIEDRFAITDTLLERTNRLSKVASGAPPKSLIWLADRFDVTIKYIRDGNDEYWSLEEGPKTPSGFGFWIFKLGQPSGWLLVAPNSADERGTPELGVKLLTTLDARLFWMSGHGTYFGTSSVLRAIGELAPLQPMMLRTLMAEDELSRNLILLRRQPAGAWDKTMLQISFGVETLTDTEIQTRIAPIADILDWWPNYSFEDGRRVTTSMNTSGQFPVKYITARESGQVITLWLAPEAIAEIDGSREKQDWLDWYLSHQVKWLKGQDYDDFLKTMSSRRVSLPKTQERLHNHANTRSEVALQYSQKLGTLTVLDSGVRLSYALELENAICIATGGTTPDDSFPYAGCWEKYQ